MNLAIVLGISDYKDPKNNLPGCKNDVEAISAVLKTSKKYQEILIIDKDTTGLNTKRKISDFVNKYQEQQIEEILFYYSGHGDFDGSKFYYLLSDYDPTKKHQTTITNDDLDGWLRAFKATMTVKIIDACQSGVQYIKEPDALEKSVNKFEGFNKIYFLFSSMTDEKSFQDASFSFFTKSLLTCITNFEPGYIRYKDLMDYISDSFVGAANSQTPFFVTQATNTETFIEVTDDIKKILEKAISLKSANKSEAQLPALNPDTNTILLEKIKKDSEEYCTEAELLSKLEFIKEMVTAHKFSDFVNDLYNFEKKFISSVSNLYGIGKLAEWIESNKDDTYFVKVNSREVKIPDNRIPIKFLGMPDTYETIYDSYSLNISVPYCGITINSEPKFENLKTHCVRILFIFSKTKLRLFFANLTYIQMNWKEKKLQGKIEWSTKTMRLKQNNEIEAEIKNILNSFESYITESIKKDIEDPNEKSS